MTDDSVGTEEGVGHRPYVKPLVRNLDALDTAGGKRFQFVEGLFVTQYFVSIYTVGPSSPVMGSQPDEQSQPLTHLCWPVVRGVSTSYPDPFRFLRQLWRK